MTVRALGQFGEDPKTKLTKIQATKILGIMAPWKSKPTMSQDDASKINKAITSTFTIAQIKKQATMGAQGMGGGGRPGGGGGMMGGGGRPGGGAPGGGGGFDPKKMMEGIKKSASANPLNPASYPESPFKKRMVDGFNKLVTDLKTAK